MKLISSRMQSQLWFVAFGYAAALVATALLLFGRYLVERADPAAASGGMFAFGDTLLYLFIGCLFLIPTVFFIWIIAKSEAAYTKYLKFLLGLSLTAPVSLVVFLLGDKYVAQSLGWLCLFRLIGSPLVLLGIGFSRWAARFNPTKRLATYASLVEGLTFVLFVAVFIYG